MVVAIEEAKDLEKLTFDELIGSLLLHEVRIDRNEDSTLETTFKSQVYISRGQGRGRSRGRGRDKNYGGKRDGREEHEHQVGSNNNISFHNNQRFDKSKVKCYYCNKFGHHAHDWRKKIADQGNQRANVSIKNTDSMFLACNTMHAPSDKVRLLDSGFSNHMIGNKNLVANLDASVKTEVKLGTDKIVDVDGKGVINILTKQGEPKTKSEVYYVSGLKQNLISVGQLTQKRYRVIFQGQECVIYDKPPRNHLIAKVQLTKQTLSSNHEL